MPSDYNYDLFKVTFPHEYVAHVEINRPDKLNAFKESMWPTLGEIFNRLSHDGDVRSIVLSGAGERAFTAGLDVKDARDNGVSSPERTRADPARTALGIRSFILEVQEAVTPIEKCQKPVIIVLHGIAFGAAIDIATACDIRIAAENTSFCVKETDLGLAADVGTLTRLPKANVPISWVKEVCLTSRIFHPPEALRVGFISESVAGPKQNAVNRGLELAQTIASKSPVATLSTKQLIDWSRDRTTQDGLTYTAIWNASMLQTSDMAKSIASSLEKKPMKYSKL